jgi:EAL domain-containing protein (putative c-di-GMP-specific phosphodiesterase class I)
MAQLLAVDYGYQYTQNLIKKTAEALSMHCNENRTLFYPRENRFIFYLSDYKGQKELIDFSNTIVKTLESLLITERIGCGIGILEINKDTKESNIDLLLRKFLIASERYIGLFGKDIQVCYYDKSLEASVNRERDIAKILSLIASDDHVNDELFLQYQPIMKLRCGSIFGFEALARIKTDKFGLVSPLEFIPSAEKTKLIHPIGEKIMLKAFCFLNKLKERGYEGTKVSINISVIQLLHPDFTNRLFQLAGELKVDLKHLGIGITESVFAYDCDRINQIIQDLIKARISIAIDDFGTCYSSLAREKEINADCMKIDKYFVDKLLDADKNTVITCDIISMAHKLGHYAIAEGVEHDIQMQYLKDHDCDMAQGYLISKPLDERDALDFLANHHISLFKH